MEADRRDGFDASARRIEVLLAALDALPDPGAAHAARELVQLVLSLHGAALEHVVEVVCADEHGPRLIEALLRDVAVRGTLLLHDLHPVGLSDRIASALERLRPHVGVQGVVIRGYELADRAVRVRLGPSDAGHDGAGNGPAIRADIERALFDAAPDLHAIDIEGLPVQAHTVPVSSITVRRRPADLATAQR